MEKAVAYYCISTDKQRDANTEFRVQEDALHLFASRENYLVTAQFIDLKSGRKDIWPKLRNAILFCRHEKTVLIIAKLDRLGRNAAFITNLMESGVDFKAVDNPYINRNNINLLTDLAKHERQQISNRTKDALQAAKRRGVQLGKHAKDILSHQNSKSADEFATRMRPIIEDIQSQGIASIRAICDELNRRREPTYRKASQGWHYRTVYALLKRIKEQQLASIILSLMQAEAHKTASILASLLRHSPASIIASLARRNTL